MTLPAVNASLNGLAAVLLFAGRAAIRRKDVTLHKRLMLSAFGTSVVFLASYLTYHFWRGGVSTPFPGAGIARGIYYVILITHVILAATVPVLAIKLLRRAYRGDFPAHKRLARWAYPIWMYVSVTGVLIYFMLYHWPV